MKPIDLRSDTVTQPTEAMRRAMAYAEVGDDVYGEDPTVNRLQELAAEKVGKEAGLFVPSGTMGNLIALLVHCRRGEEMLVGNRSHIFLSERGGASALGGIHSRQLPNQPDGSLALSDLQAAIRPDDIHDPVTRLICLENTHNECGGVYQSPQYVHQVGELARRYGLSLHLDGARLFNAAVAQGIDARELTAPVDSVTFCLSKGLCAPVGSVLCGSRAFIAEARKVRKMLGGGMRQAGILAAAGIVALETMIDRLAEDHARARWLADGLKQLPGLLVDEPATNMVFFSWDESIPYDERRLIAELRAQGVLAGSVAPRRIRLVTHYGIDDSDIEQTLRAFRAILSR
ncbi:MAG: low-specificity L-threonine aldolase [Anaerolineales bacterium]|nr:low-specificity L-threonine aldolase [Anaerolineales bacterium]MCX7608075.1 low-specificity L-threonine aldolase [Anaerolineales bacterium]MDW8227698.1 low-specificity L-threonine aldolase [Anaerolineales bacterium]